MATKVDVKKILEDRLKATDDELKNLKPGSEEYSRLFNNLCNVAEKLNNMQQTRDQAEDNAAKLEETKRMNDEELKIKQAQLDNETIRAINEKEMREKQFTGNLLVDIGKMLCMWAGMAAYEHRYHRVMGMEYAMSEGTSVTPPNNVQRLLAEGKPKTYNF